ncbi:MAG: hypothetical protein WKI04_05915 [Ferruginibacter sp.]
MADELTHALGETVEYNDVTPETYRGFGFPGADDLGNMFQFYQEFEHEFVAARDIDFTKELNPSVQSFNAWLVENAKKLPLD